MDYIFLLFCLFIFLIELPVIYTPLYLLSYKVWGIDKKINDNNLVILLLLITLIAAILLFPVFLRIISTIIL